MNLKGRAVDWIGQSIIRSDYDDKVADLCTALECLLTTKDDKMKGEAIAIRAMVLATLVDDGFRHPFDVLNFYDLRSKIVHGSARGICSDSDYMSLRQVTTDILEQVIQLIHNDDRITKPKMLIDALQQNTLLDQVESWLDGQPKTVSKTLRPYVALLRR